MTQPDPIRPDPVEALELNRALDTIQRNIWARINDEANLRSVKLDIGDAYSMGSVIKEVLHPAVRALLKDKDYQHCEVCKVNQATRKGVEHPSEDYDITHGYFCDTCVAYPCQSAVKPKNFELVRLEAGLEGATQDE